MYNLEFCVYYRMIGLPYATKSSASKEKKYYCCEVLTQTSMKWSSAFVCVGQKARQKSDRGNEIVCVSDRMC